MLINGSDARTTYGLVLTEAPGWRDVPPARYSAAVIPGRPGSRILDVSIGEQPRKLSLRGAILGTSVADARTKLDRLYAVIRGQSFVRITLDDQPTREYRGIVDTATVSPPEASLIAAVLPITLELTCVDPYAYELTATSFSFGGAGTACPLGSGPVRPLITLTATTLCQAPTFTLLKSDGVTVVTTMRLADLAAGQSYVIDCDTMTIKDGTGANKLSALVSGDFFVLDVATQGDFAASAWPKIKVTFSNAPTYTTNITYRKAWR